MRLLCSLAAAAVLGFCGLAGADTINVYSLNATLVDGSAFGTLTLNATTGMFTGANFTVTASIGSASFTDAPTTVLPQATYTGNIFSNSNPDITFALLLPTASLANYAGGSLCTQNSLCAGNTSMAAVAGLGTDNVTSGMLTLISSTAVAVTPEPSSLILLGTGVLGLGAVLRRRPRF